MNRVQSMSIIQMSAVAGLIGLTGCGMSATQVRARDLCYSRAEAAAQARVDDECSAGSFAECPARHAILDELRRAQEACP